MAQNIDPEATVQTISLGPNELKFKTPCTICISGSSMSGKTEFMLKLLLFRKDVFDTDFEEIYFCAPESASLRHDPVMERIKMACPNIKFIAGMPDIEKLHLTLDFRPKLLFLDDLQDTLLNSNEMLKLMTANSHHFNISIAFSLQNFHHQSKFGRTLFRQISYRVIFYNRLDLTEIRALASQLQESPKFLVECFTFLLKRFPNEPAYILFDGHGLSLNSQLFIRTRIFPEEKSKQAMPIFFFPKK
ncbi:MAG: hypothetical protein FJ333_06920 [Sphingomonadales bacterium]|nr:hypothetical protein [Sphingomonadales bacterium]